MMPFLVLLLIGLSACASDPAMDGGDVAAVDTGISSSVGAKEWMSAPQDGVEVGTESGRVVLRTGPHAIAWPREGAVLRPPYVVEAELRKRQGRLHEGFGLIFGGDPLDAEEARQRYGYFLVRGDGSYLIKRRDGTETSILRNWTSHPAVGRDTEEGGPANRLRVEVGKDIVAFHVNGEEVARIPTQELPIQGVSGVRLAHDVELEVRDFAAAEDGSE